MLILSLSSELSVLLLTGSVSSNELQEIIS